MDSKSTPLSIKVIYYITQIAFWCTVAGGAIIIVIIMTNLMGGSIGGSETSVSIPIKLNIEETGVMQLDGQDYNVNIFDASGTFKFDQLPPQVLGFMMPFGLGLIVLVLLAIWFFRKLIINVRNGDYFNTKNISYLKYMAYSLMGLWAFILVVSNIFAGFVINTIEFDSVSFSGIKSESSHLLFGALFLWVLSHIFSTGVKLQKEQELTI